MKPHERLEKIAADYTDHYELCDCEDENGRIVGDYKPTERERLMILDAINGLICDELFCEVFLEARAVTHAAREREGSCIRCGAPNGYEHYYNCIARATGQQP